MPVIEVGQRYWCWEIDARGLGDREWADLLATTIQPMRWSEANWYFYGHAGLEPNVMTLGDVAITHFKRVGKTPTPRGKKVTILPGAKGL